jgi:hypothetical protein
MRIVVGAFRKRRLASAGEILIDHRRSEISHAGRVLHLAPRLFRVIAGIVVSPGGADSLELAELLYADRADGGPRFLRNVPAHAVCVARGPLAEVGLRIVRRSAAVGARGGARRYEIAEVLGR